MDQDLTHREKSAGDASPAIGLLPSRWHYAWVIVAVTFAVVVVSAGVRATPGVLIVPLEEEFHWSRATISFALGINLLLFGAIGPFAAAVMDRCGARRTMTLALAATAVSVLLTPARRRTSSPRPISPPGSRVDARRIEDSWRRKQIGRLEAWGFNTIGNWGEPDLSIPDAVA